MSIRSAARAARSRQASDGDTGHRVGGTSWIPSACLVALVGVAIAIYGGSLWGRWVAFDDHLNVTENPGLFPASWPNLLRFWTAPYEHLFIPASYTLYWLEAIASRWAEGLPATATPRPWLFHGVSVGLHIANAGLVFQLLRRLGIDWRAPLLGSLVFLAHPLQVESVCWVSEQRGLLAAFFSLLALWWLGRWLAQAAAGTPGRADALLATGAFALALLSKPSALPLPLAAFAWPFVGDQPSKRRRALLLATWVGLALVAALLTRFSQPLGLVTYPAPAWLRPTISADAIAFYATKLFVPVDLCAMYGRSPIRVAGLPATPLVAIGTAVGLAGLFGLARFRAARVPAAVFLAFLLPTLGFVPFVFQNTSTVADRYAYLAMLGPALGVCHLVAWRPRLGGPIVAGAVVALGLLSWRQAATWSDTQRLAEQAVAVAPGDAWGWSMLAGAALYEGNPAAAAQMARRALAIEPRHPLAALNLAGALGMQHEFAASEEALGRLDPAALTATHLWLYRYTQGLNALHRRHDEQARSAFEEAARLNPFWPSIRLNLAVVLVRLDRLDEAAAQLERLIATDEHDAAAWIGLGNVAYRRGDGKKADEMYSRAISLRPDDPDGFLNRARARLLSDDRRGAAADVAAAEALGAVDEELRDAANRDR